MGMDPDVVNPTRDNAANSYGTWSLQAAQVEKEATQAKQSDPYYVSSHPENGGYMINHYPGEGVLNENGEPHVMYNFDPALDSDIADTHTHLQDTEARLGHTF